MKVKRIFIDIKAGCLQGVYGDRLDTKEQIAFFLRDWDNILAGDKDPADEGDLYLPEVYYW